MDSASQTKRLREVRQAETTVRETELAADQRVQTLEGQAARLRERMYKLRASLDERSRSSVPMPHNKENLHHRYSSLNVESELPPPQHQEALTAREQAVHSRERAAALCHQSAAVYEEHLERVALRLRDEEEITNEAEIPSRGHRSPPMPGPYNDPASSVELASPIVSANEDTPVPDPVTKKPQRGGQRYRRRHYEAVVGYETESNFFAGFSSNISEGGLFVATINLPPVSSVVEIRFSLPSGFEASSTGEVKWTRDWNEMTPDVAPGFGVSFKSLRDDTRQAIQSFVSQREPIFYDLEDMEMEMEFVDDQDTASNAV